jgi:hypothetical protein
MQSDWERRGAARIEMAVPDRRPHRKRRQFALGGLDGRQHLRNGSDSPTWR